MKRRIKLIFILAIVLILIFLFFMRCDKSINDFATTSGVNYVNSIINDCVLKSIETNSAEYNNICKIHVDSAGKITAISVNSGSVNKLKSDTVSLIIKTLKNETKDSFKVPLGTLTGSRFFSAKGPEVELTVIPLGTVASELVQKFTSVGINQTLHSLYLEIRICVKIASPFSSADINVSTNVCIAETVIVGEIPFSFRN